MSNFSVRVELDSIAPCKKRLTTIVATFPRIILSEVNTHRDRARNAASSRAIPFVKMSESIAASPFVPIEFGQEMSGMQTAGEIPEKMVPLARKLWLEAMQSAMSYATRLHNIGVEYASLYRSISDEDDKKVKVHKSIPNRIIEPWMWCTQVMSATEWNNFFRLRCHGDAEIHFQKIAKMIREAIENSTPTQMLPGDWHLPFVTNRDIQTLVNEGYDIESIKRISVSRCARVSYLTHDNVRDPEKDLELFDRLVQGSGFGHWSAHEHVAEPCDYVRKVNENIYDHCTGKDEFVRSGPYVGWRQFRKEFPNENMAG